MTGLSYDGYLKLQELLSLQQPLTSREFSERLRASEHFFIVVHQATELFLQQTLIDLKRVLIVLPPPELELELSLEHLDRVGEITRVLLDHVGLLSRLPLACFAEFRPRLHGASGAQSTQFHELEKLLGLRGEPSPLYSAFLSAVRAEGLNVNLIYRDDLKTGPLYRIGESLLEISHRLWQWKVVHLEIACRLLGAAPGTGGSSGVRHLARHMESAFPELWEARNVAHRRQTAVSDSSVSAG